MARIKLSKEMVKKINDERKAKAEYEANYQIESTIMEAFDATRNTIAVIGNVAKVMRNKSEMMAVESVAELERAYAELAV